ncbi:MAG TPA: glycosyltransferase family 2 protein [Patescibacteria group bacterium]|nr:glycosyltransferase family 2 protein [Patescibacteria group bacterium]
MLQTIKKRFFEILPGALTWSTFILAVILSIWLPIGAIFFIIIFDLLWLTKVYYLVLHQIISWSKFRKEVNVNWLAKIKAYDKKDWRDYYHLIFIPTYKEPFSVIDKTFEHLSRVRYDANKFIIVLAGEERDKSNFLDLAGKIEQKYNHLFFKILITLHPQNLPDEIPGKGSNANYAGHFAQKLIDDLGIPYGKVIVSNFDADTRPHPQYFSYLTYKYITHPNPTRVSYQPIALYHNNIWESDPFTRVVANSTTFWLMTDLARSDRLFTFSSHSMSFQALVDVGFWQKDIVSEDSRIFLQCLFKYDGDYQVEPMYIPVSMNTVNTGKFWQALADQYKQMRRWAWGVEHIPYMIRQFKQHPHMPFGIKFKHFFNQLEGMWSWATAPILITLMGRLPLWFAGKEVQATVVAQLTPLILQWLMTFALIGLILNAFLSTLLMPQRPRSKKGWYRYPMMFLEWLLFPITMIVFGSIPATEAQTRLMLGGKYRLGFWVAGKK